MHNLLFEIGTEEIPAGYIEPALQALSSIFSQKLADLRIEHDIIRVFGTPRRLAAIIKNLSKKQKDLSTEVIGPSQQAGYDSCGNPYKAAFKFAEKLGISVEQIYIKETNKGNYLCGQKIEQGLSTFTILIQILPEIIRLIPFPKTMKWSKYKLQFARPIHSILAFLDYTIIPITLENIKSSGVTFGHRFMFPDKIKIENCDEYIEKLRNAFVIADISERKKMVEKEISDIAKKLGGNILIDKELISIVNNLVEYPAAAAGKFDAKFLELPKEILITSMREHQKYFAVIDENNKLMPHFIAVNNTLADDMSLVAKGHERVLRARLTDAQFFYQSDLKQNLNDWVDKLKGVLFHAKLGSMHDKVLRIVKLVKFLSDTAGFDNDFKQYLSRAAYLCKADLVSQVVCEFPKLQGIMGRIYAQKHQESETTSIAIEEHYRPVYSGAVLPDTLCGAILAIADKMDTLCGCFNAKLIPTGASDPYALRRQSIGIIQILLDKNLEIPLSKIIEKSLSFFVEKDLADMSKTTELIYNFLQNRIAHLLEEQGFSKDIISAVISVSIDNVPNIWNRIKALEKLKSMPDFEPLAIAFKRVVNIIIKKTDPSEFCEEIDEKLFQHDSESLLFEAYKSIENKTEQYLKEKNFDTALLKIVPLKKYIDSFFDNVMVLTDDLIVRRNRLTLLKKISNLFAQFADFSKMS